MVATETEAAPAESTGPTVNIQTTEAAMAEPVHTTAAELELTVKTMTAGPAEGGLNCGVVSQADRSSNNLGVSCEKSGISDSAPSIEQVQKQCASVELVVEIQPVATMSGLDKSLADSSHVPEAAAEKRFVEVINVEGEEDAPMMEEKPLMSKGGNYDFRFTVAPAYIRDCEEEERGEEETKEITLEEEVADVKNARERKLSEGEGKRVQFSSEVQYFEGDKFSTELEDSIEEVDEEEDHCALACNSKCSPFEKEKYHYVQADSSEDETERIQTEGKKEGPEEEFDEEEINVKLGEGCVEEKVSEVREDGKKSEEEEKGQSEVLKKEETEEPDQKSSPHHVTLTEPLTPDAPLTYSPPAVSQSEVTLHQLRWAQPGPCNLTSTLPFCRHNLPLIIKGKTSNKSMDVRLDLLTSQFAAEQIGGNLLI